jgi:hypothetical protein
MVVEEVQPEDRTVVVGLFVQVPIYDSVALPVPLFRTLFKCAELVSSISLIVFHAELYPTACEVDNFGLLFP